MTQADLFSLSDDLKRLSANGDPLETLGRIVDFEGFRPIYVIWEARNLGVSRVVICKMLTNLAVHASIGAIPILGNVFDAFFRVNQRNMRIVRAQLGKLPESNDA